MSAPLQQAMLMIGAAAACDPYWYNVVLLTPFEDVNASTGPPGTTDFSPAAHGNASRLGTATIDTSQFPFGTSSLSLLSTGGSLAFADSPDWTLSSANSDQFTIECWVRFNTTGINKIFLCQYGNSGTFAWGFQTGASASEFQFASSSDGTTFNVVVASSGAGLTTGVWYPLAVDKDATGKIRLYKNGVMVASSTPANSIIFNSTSLLTIGATAVSAGPVIGWLKQARVTKGVARYASDAGYTPATSLFPMTSCAPPLPSGIIGWWDASIFPSLNLTGSNINSVADQSGGGNTMNSVGNKPTYNATGFNTTKPAMVFSRASSQSFQALSFPMGVGNTMTCWVVGAGTSTITFNDYQKPLSYAQPPGTDDSGNNGSWCILRDFNSNTGLGLRRNAGWAEATTIAINAPFVCIGTVSTAGSNNISTYMNGGAAILNTNGGNWTTGGTMRMGAGAGGVYWDGVIAECGVATGLMDAVGVAAFYRYLKAKWGL